MNQLWSGVVVIIILSVLLIVSCVEEPDDAPNAQTLFRSNFRETLQQKDTFVMFFAPWCGHCKRMKPVWEDLALRVNNDEKSKVQIAKVDCTKDTDLCSTEGIRGYPTLLFYHKEDVDTGIKYVGPRTVQEFDEFILERQNLDQEPKQKDLADEEDGLYELTTETFPQHVKYGDHFVKFYAPWCGHCKKLIPVWQQLAESFEDSNQVTIGKVDCTKHNKICNQFDVKGYPTLAYLRDGQINEKYQGSRDFDTLLKFVNRKIGEQNVEGATDDDGKVVVPEYLEPETGDQLPKTDLTDQTFQSVVEGSKLVFVKFYVPWCSHCKRLAPTWEQLGRHFLHDSYIHIASIDCTDSKTVCQQNEVAGYPTLILFKDGVATDQYSGDRNLDNLVQFINNHRPKDEL